MNHPDPAELPAALALASKCPADMWPEVSAFLRVEHDDTEAPDRFRAAAALEGVS